MYYSNNNSTDYTSAYSYGRALVPGWGRSRWRGVGTFDGSLRLLGLLLAGAHIFAPQWLAAFSSVWVQRLTWVALLVIIWPLARFFLLLTLRLGGMLVWLMVAGVLLTHGTGLLSPVPASLVNANTLPSMQYAQRFSQLNPLTDLWKYFSGAENNESLGASTPPTRVVRVRSLTPARHSSSPSVSASLASTIDIEALRRRYEVSILHSGPQSWERSRADDYLYFGGALKQAGRNWFGGSYRETGAFELGTGSGARTWANLLDIESVLAELDGASKQLLEHPQVKDTLGALVRRLGQFQKKQLR